MHHCYDCICDSDLQHEKGGEHARFDIAWDELALDWNGVMFVMFLNVLVNLDMFVNLVMNLDMLVNLSMFVNLSMCVNLSMFVNLL